MGYHDLHISRVLVLGLLAIAVGCGVLWLDSDRRASGAALTTAAATAGAADPLAAVTDDPVLSTAADAAPATPPGTVVSDAAAAGAVAAPAAPVTTARRGGVACAAPHRTVEVPGSVVVRASPGGRAIANMPSQSKYLGQPMQAWVQAVSADGLWGKVSIPWTKPVGAAGWIPLTGLAGQTTTTMVVADLSERRLHVYRGCRELFGAGIAVGRPGSPSPTGRFWVTDRVAVPAAQRMSFGTYAFGLSTVQPNLPRGWTGGDQMAIHGTGAPGSIGQAASAGCLRVREETLTKLRPLLRNGTPVVIQA